MARKKKEDDEQEEAPQTTTLAQFMAVTNKQLGERTIATGLDAKRDPPRIPFGVFPVDYSTGGGFPLWATSGAYGPESGGKTTLALSAVGSVARTCWRCFHLLDRCSCSLPAIRMKSFWADAEGTLDPGWAQCAGANPEDYYYCLAEYGEQYVNLAENALRADDCGLVLIDSLAALTPASVLEADSEDQFIGVQARMITRAVQRLKQRLISERKREHPCCLMFINQIRTNIKVKYGDPEGFPGGHALRHEFSLLLRIVKKPLSKEGGQAKFIGKDEEKDKASVHAFTIRKEKVMTLARSGEFLRFREDYGNLPKGTVDDFVTVAKIAKHYGILRQEGKTWVCGEQKSTRLIDIVDAWKTDLPYYRSLQADVIKAAKDEIESRGVDAEQDM